ncbi:hypothetical protein EXIGLDRAFT_715925 [Exidia glandulosa HHB12029]|uniref:HSF-type DNA-binding domain-containing protein n=1 Tax=Exidia glandulosa HHB12029 TaxID=1314781 RepID=A0A165QP86_EXIGL|nr:hypothetical protein EXIGLDRAFT_715925 [Exidia glandulosa HHB12029]
MADIYAPYDAQQRPVAYQGAFNGQPGPLDNHQSQSMPQQQQSPQDHDSARGDDGDLSQNRPGEAKTETKPQATFLTKLYALLERPENHHMIRWDANGDHIIVERPEQLALHVLPSVYRQSRFASFSRQLNIYGFMRKVNLRNVDPSIDDPDASTWSHPTLNRHSPPEVVANFKRRVPPRLPKAKKRSDTDMLNPPRSAAGSMGPFPLTVPSSVGRPGMPGHMGYADPSGAPFKTRSRGFSAPGSFTPLNPTGAQWQPGSYSRPPLPLPPLTVPSEAHSSSMYHSMSHSATEDTPQQAAFNYSGSGVPPPRDHNSSVYMQHNSYSYPSHDQHNWGFQSQINLNASSPSSLSSLLNPSVPSSHPDSRPAPISTHLSPVQSYPSPFSSVPLQNTPSGSSMSPDSRPTTGYSTNYDDGNSMDCSRPNTGNRPVTPGSVGRPGSSHNTLSIRRGRRHSQAVNPYPNPYDMSEQRPGTAPSLSDMQQPGMQRTKSLMQLPSVESYCFNPAQAEFAYSANGPGVGSTSSVDSMEGSWMSPGQRNGSGATPGGRPSTAHSTMSTQSHSSANTPPMETPFEESEVNRFQSRPTSATSQ